MQRDTTVLSLSLDSAKLVSREKALRAAGFEVFSVRNATQAWFEIEMGRCGVFVTCHKVSPVINRELIELFQRSCLEGSVILVTEEPPTEKDQLNVDARVSELNDPEGVLEFLQARFPVTKAS